MGDQEDSQSLGGFGKKKISQKKETKKKRRKRKKKKSLLVENSEVFVGLSVPLVVLYRAIETDGLEGRFLPRGHNIPPYAAPGEVVEAR